MTTGYPSSHDTMLAKLYPLRQGKTVSMVVESTRRIGRKQKLVQTGLLLAPGQLYGLSTDVIVVSLLGSGSCVIRPASMKGAGELVKAGMPARLAKALLDKLRVLYGDT